MSRVLLLHLLADKNTPLAVQRNTHLGAQQPSVSSFLQPAFLATAMPPLVTFCLPCGCGLWRAIKNIRK
jgi:hypothetical protein